MVKKPRGLIDVPTMERSPSDYESLPPMSFHKAIQGVRPFAKEISSVPISPVKIDEEQRTNFIIQQTNQKAEEMRDEARRQKGITHL